MAHPLDGARLKVVRAQQHLDELKAKIGEYLGTKPYATPQQRNNEVITATPVITSAPPLSLGCIVGDFVANLRTSLDYIAWQLTIRFPPKGSPLSTDEERSVYFPLEAGAAKFANAKRVKLLRDRCSVPAPAIDQIELSQPYHAGNGPLKTLLALVNEDKHRLPVLAKTEIDSARIKITVEGVGVFEAAGHKSFSLALYADKDGTPFQPTGKVDVDGEPTLVVTIDNPAVPVAPADRTLADIIKCVSDIIPRFDPFF